MAFCSLNNLLRSKQHAVHLKPDNIWLEPNRLGSYRVKVLDFGIAKLAETAVPAEPEPEPNVFELAESRVSEAVSVCSEAATSLQVPADEVATLQFTNNKFLHRSGLPVLIDEASSGGKLIPARL
ncbi:MAG: hypothetical protein ABR555_18450 [Pyrinomonadaceae bacterium]